MAFNHRALFLGLACAAGGAPADGRAQTSTPPDSAATSVLAGVYTAAQARSGEAVFRSACADCHALRQFQDSNFLRPWEGRAARDLFEAIRTQMPQDNPGQLRRDEYAAVLAFIFELSGFPSSDSTLGTTDAALRRVRIERKLPRP